MAGLLTPYEAETYRQLLARLGDAMERGDVDASGLVLATRIYPHAEPGAARRREALTRMGAKGFLDTNDSPYALRVGINEAVIEALEWRREHGQEGQN